MANYTKTGLKSGKRFWSDRKAYNGTTSVIDWPPQNPDFNNMEELWDHLDIDWITRQTKKHKTKQKPSRSLLFKTTL